MSYIRVGPDSDVYVIGGLLGLECLGCCLGNDDHSGFFNAGLVGDGYYAYTPMVEHLKAHKKAGHKVPKRVFRSLYREAREQPIHESHDFTHTPRTGVRLIARVRHGAWGTVDNISVWIPGLKRFRPWSPYTSFEDGYFPEEQLPEQVLAAESRSAPRQKTRVFRTTQDLYNFYWYARVKRARLRREAHEGPAVWDIENMQDEHATNKWIEERRLAALAKRTTWDAIREFVLGLPVVSHVYAQWHGWKFRHKLARSLP